MAAISANIFEKCLPAIGSSINSCGALTECDIVTATPTDLDTIFKSGGDYRDLSTLLMTQFEIRACGAKQNGLFDFLMANAKPMKNRVIKTPLGYGNSDIAPFIMAETTSVINDRYWTIVAGTDPGAGNWTVTVVSPGNVDLDLSWFPTDIRVFTFGLSAGGSAVRAAYKVVSASATTHNASPAIAVVLTPLNGGTYLAAAKVENITTGFLVLGTPNVADVEKWCNNRPALNNRKHVPFWFQTSRWTMCVDELYERAFARLRNNNEYFRLFGDIEIAKRNKQYGERFQQDWLNDVFWGKAISANQTLANYRNLDPISAYTDSTLATPSEGRCVGRKASAIGIYEQLAQCGRVKDLQGNQLNLEELFEDLYQMWRSRDDQGQPSDIIEVFTDSYNARLLKRGMIQWLDNEAAGNARFMIDTKQVMQGQAGALGFNYDRYNLDYPAGVQLRVVTHKFFDDFVTQAKNSNTDSQGRMMWFLNWQDIYPGIIASNRTVHKTGDINDLAKIDSDYACVMDNPTQEVSLNSLTFSTILECPSSSLILENMATVVPDASLNKSGVLDDDYTVYP